MILPTCKDVSTALARGDYEEAPALKRLLARVHLLICWHCRRFKAQMGFIGAALKKSVFAQPEAAKIAVLERKIIARLGI